MLLAALPFGLGIGLSLGMVGGGGSILAVPVLVYVLGQSIHQATTGSLVIVTAGAIVGSISHAREGRVCWRHAVAFIAGTVPGVIAGTALGQAASGTALIVSFAAIMLIAAGATWRRVNREPRSGLPEEPRPSCPPLRLARDIAAGLLIGAMTGFFGIGGGFLIVPTLAIVLALSLRLAVGTSLVIITVTSVIALVAHLAAGRTLDLPVTLAMTVACAAGAMAGGHLAGYLPQRRLASGFAALVAGVASYMLVSAIFLGGPAGTS